MIKIQNEQLGSLDPVYYCRMSHPPFLQSLLQQTWVMLRPSSLHGIGVFAIRDIPAGCREMFSPEPGEWHTVPRTEVDALPSFMRDLVENYCLYDETNYFIPAGGFRQMDLSLFLNHSDQPNLRSVDEGAYFETLRPISAGEELLIDYGTLVEEA